MIRNSCNSEKSQTCILPYCRDGHAGLPKFYRKDFLAILSIPIEHLEAHQPKVIIKKYYANVNHLQGIYRMQ